MADCSSINRTSYPKYVTYTGDGSGRDGYVTFANGGLHELRNYQGSQPKSGFDNMKARPKQTSIPRKEATAFDYVPDGTGRDSYIIFNYGLKANYRSAYNTFQRDLRSHQQTPMMDARASRRMDPFGIDTSTYNNWPSPSARRQNRQVFNEQRVSIERLSASPSRQSGRGSPRTDIDLADISLPLHKISNPKTPVQTTSREQNEQFFSQRNTAGPKASQSSKQNRSAQTGRKNDSQRFSAANTLTGLEKTFRERKSSIQPSIMKAGVAKKLSSGLKMDEDGTDYAPAFRKKMSVPNGRANSTLHGGRLVVDSSQKTGIRFKKVGNLMTVEPHYQGGAARISALAKTSGGSDKLFFKNIFQEQQTPEKVAKELQTLKQQNQKMRAQANLLPSQKPALVSRASAVDPSFNYMQKSVTVMEHKSRQNNTAAITEEMRKGVKSDLRIKKIDTEMTGKGSTRMGTSVNATRHDPRQSMDRNMMQDQDYGSISSPCSPAKGGGRSKLTTSVGRQIGNTEQKNFQQRRNTATLGRETSNMSGQKRSSSVLQTKPLEINAMMTRTAPQGFYKGGARE